MGAKLGKGTWTKYAKRQAALSMYDKGRSFVAAAILVEDRAGNQWVVLHLICQGIEIVLKALLLFKDFDAYKPRLKREFGHTLLPLVQEVLSAYNLNPLRPQLAAELEKLAPLYARHLLRYGSFYDLLVHPQTVPCHGVIRRLGAGIRLANRELAKDPPELPPFLTGQAA